MNSALNENTVNVEKRTSLCKCGKKADFIKDYWVTEAKLLKENYNDDVHTRNVDSVCGILRRRYCAACLSKIAAVQRRANKRLNTIIFLSVMIPLLFGTALTAISYFIFSDKNR